jgi:hypothetical protein
LQRAFASSASLNRSFRKHPFSASFIDYWLGGHRIASAAKARPGRSGHHTPATVRSFEPTDACLWQTSPRVHSLRRLQAGRRQPFVDVRCGLYLASFPQERLTLFACRRRIGLLS